MVSTQVNIPGYQVSEELYNSSRTLVYRGVREIDLQPVVIKLLKNPYPSFVELVKFRNQYTITKNLNLPGIIQTYSLESYQNSYALVMEDFGGISLKDFAKLETLDVKYYQEFLLLALSLCDTLDFLIRHRIIHKDIKPANILINPGTKEVKLIDFSIASLLPRETQTLISPNVLEGTLAYISPEQTGRMNRGIDYRTDFYSLGVTFYQLLTGELPFQSGDAMELVHCHIAKAPPLVHEINSAIPFVLSQIVSKLMAKNAEDRYQSVFGLKYDLEQCLIQLKKTDKIETFPIAQRDVCDRFIIPDKLYGREGEVATLLQAFERVSTGVTEMMLVVGFSGIGKTVVVNEVHKPIVRQQGYFIKGKYDQFNRNIPFSAFVQAFRDLMGQLLTESDVQIQHWKTKILDTLGENGQVIIEVIPELERIIGQQPPAIEITGTAAQNRFNLLFQKFVQVFTTKEHPLVMFLDDLQWVDSASLKLIQLLMNESSGGYLLLIGAYRDNEVSSAHPLILSLEEIKKSHAIINTITLTPLSHSSLNKLVADTLSCSEEIAQPLTELVYQKTKGNPFFSTQFIKALYEDGLIKFDGNGGHWQCDISEVRALALSDNVVEFMALQLQKLPQETQSVLKLAACIGNQFDLTTLAIVSQQSEIETATGLWKALQEELILPTSEIYKFYLGKENQNIEQDVQIVNYKFLHDRVQQAAYALIPEERKQHTHLEIGRLLLANTPAQQQSERLFEIVNHFNIAIALLDDQSEREMMAQFNLRAAEKARASTAYAAAFNYAQVGTQLLGTASWERQYHLTLALSETLAEAAFLNGDFETVPALVQLVLDRAQIDLDRVKTYETIIQFHIIRQQYQEAIARGLEILQQFGLKLSPKPNRFIVLQELLKTKIALWGKSNERLLDLPEISTPEKIATLRILDLLQTPAYFLSVELMLVFATVGVQLTLQYGNTPWAASFYNALSMILANVGDLKQSYQIGQLAIILADRFGNLAITAKVKATVPWFSQLWQQDVRSGIPIVDDSIKAAMDSGNLTFLGVGGYMSIAIRLEAGIPLDEITEKIRDMEQVIVQSKDESSQYLFPMYLQAVANVRETSTDPYTLVGTARDEMALISQWQNQNEATPLIIMYRLKFFLAYLFEDIPVALSYADTLLPYNSIKMGLSKTDMFDPLIRLAAYTQSTKRVKKQLLQEVNEMQRLLWKCAQLMPDNFQHKYDLVEAEKCRVLAKFTKAIELYDRAIAGAKANKYIHEEALANELAAKFYLNWGKEKVAQTYMQEAYYCYARWGAKAKILHLEKCYSQLLTPILQSAAHPSRKEALTTIHGTVSHSTSSLSNLLDLDTILKISQSFTSEIHLEQLVEQIMQALVSTAGADKGALILNQEGHLAVVSQYRNSQVHPFEIQPLDHCFELPISIVHYVARTLEVTIASAEIPDIFAGDPYFSNHSPQSLLCTPILKQGQLIGLLYLENTLTSLAFTSDRLEILNLLCTQAAISLENATLYNTLEHKVIERTHELSQALNDLKAAQKKLVESEKMAALGGLVAGVAHEINTPVGIGITLASTLAEETKIFKATITEGQLKKSVLNSYLNTAEDCSNLMLTNLQRAGELIQSFKQVAVDQTNLEQRQIPLKLYLEDIITSLNPKLRQAGHSLTVTGDETIEIFTYPGAVAQMLVNLLTNSLIHAYPTGKPGQLAIHISQTQENVILVYSDDGCGIPPDTLGKIFEPFFTTARDRGGSGLGLHIVYNLVTQKLGGAIDVDSQVGHGTLFTIKLPRSF